MGRILIAGLIGAIIMFAWGYVSHMHLQLGNMGIKDLPNEKSVIPELSSAVKGHGLYRFPSMQAGAEMPTEGPMGMLVFNPNRKIQMTNLLLLEFASNFLAALLMAAIAVNLRGAYLSRVFLTSLVGLIGWLSISVSYWIWDDFPRDFTAAEGAMQFVGWLASGIAIAAIARPATPQPAMVMQ